MNRILTVKLLGHPEIRVDGTVVTFPFRQAEAIVYYLLMERTANKDVLADMIWGEKYDTGKMKANLRNALYIIRKLFGRDFLLEGKNDVLEINPQWELRLDLAEIDSPDFLSAGQYPGDFLSGFYLKDNELFNEWIDLRRQKMKSLLIGRLHKLIADQDTAKDPERRKRLCLLLTRLDEFDELAYRTLIQLFRQQGDYSNALQVYHRLEKLLADELFIQPSDDLNDLARELRRDWNREIVNIIEGKDSLFSTMEENTGVPFCGRSKELRELETAFQRFFSGRGGAALNITGETGIGKTLLAEKALNWFSGKEVIVLRTRCYLAEKDHLLKPWQHIVEQLLDEMKKQDLLEKHQRLVQSLRSLFPFLAEEEAEAEEDDYSSLERPAIREVVTSLLLRLARTRRLVIFFDDIQWLDEMSISFIRDILLKDQNRHILFLFAFCSGSQGESRFFLENMELLRLVRPLSLQRFSFEDTACVLSHLLPGHNFTPNDHRQFYRETEGNPFFITEIARNMEAKGCPSDITPNIRNALGQRLTLLPTDARRILNLMSIFFDGASFRLLTEMSNKDEHELIEILESLISHNLIRESASGSSIVFQFTHRKIQEYIYGEMSWTQKRILHNRAGLCYEGTLKGTKIDFPLYSKLLYHYERGDNQEKYMVYAVKNTYLYLNVAHEFFPFVDHDTPVGIHGALLNDLNAVEPFLRSIEEKVTGYLQDYLSAATAPEQLQLASDFYHMMGRYHILKCNYPKGLDYIFQLKELNREARTPEQRSNIIKANRQLLCVYINRYEPDLMAEVIAQSFEILGEDTAPEERGVWLRMRGLCDIMRGQPETGADFLEQAIRIFDASARRERYLYNLAASYAWLGESKRHLGLYQEAAEAYQSAIALCGNKVGGVSIFYTYAGMAALDSGCHALAKEHLRTAVDCYARGTLLWGRGLAYCYYALTLLREGQYARGIESLKQALEYGIQLESDYEKGVVFRVFAQLKAAAAENLSLAEAVSGLLPQEKEHYLDMACLLLAKVYSPVDTEYLRRLGKGAAGPPGLK